MSLDILIKILAILSAAAAGGMRIGLPLLIIGLAYSDRLWSDIPLLESIPPQVVLGVLTSWSLFELVGSKKFMGLRIIQLVQLLFSPLVGALMAIGVAKLTALENTPLWLIGVVGALLALVLKLVQVGWFFRLRGIPMIAIITEDILSVLLVILALNVPENGGLIAMLLLWIALRSSSAWRDWYREGRSSELKMKN
jgi:hypothetical protein